MPQVQYFCHQCQRSFEIEQNAPIACIRCNGEFVEFVDRPAMVAAAMPPAQAIQQIFGFIRGDQPQGEDMGGVQERLRENSAREAQAGQVGQNERSLAERIAEARAYAEGVAQALHGQNRDDSRQQEHGAAQPQPAAAQQPNPQQAAEGEDGAPQQQGNARFVPRTGFPTLDNFVQQLFTLQLDQNRAADDTVAGDASVTISFEMPGGFSFQVQAPRGQGGTDGGGASPLQQMFNLNAGPANLENTMAEILATFQGEGGTVSANGFREADIIEFLPMSKVSKEQADNGAQCTTCFDTFKFDEDVGCLDCKHIFHRPCIEPWLKTKSSCPVCRQSVDMKAWKARKQRRAQEAVLEDLD